MFSSTLKAPTLCDSTCWRSRHFPGPQTWKLCSKPLNFRKFPRSRRLGLCKNAKNAMFFASNPYRLWSLQLGAENMSKVGSFSENIVFCGIKLNYCSVHNFRGARILIYLFACRLARFMHENCGALHWDFPTRKKHGLFCSKFTASRVCNGNLGWL